MKIQCMLPAGRGVYPQEHADRRFRVMQSFATPSVQIDVDYLPGVSGFNPFGGGGATVEMRQKTDELALQRILQAEKEGYDAFIPFGMLDFGVEKAKGVAKIPVIGQSWAAFLVAGMIGVPFFTISYQSSMGFDRHQKRAKEHGIEHLMVWNTAAEMSNADMPKYPDELKSRVVARAQEAKAKGAELMMVTGMSICPVEFSAKELSEATGMPVIEGMGCAVAVAELLHRLGVPASLVRLPRAQG